jgi:hypothetical protein
MKSKPVDLGPKEEKEMKGSKRGDLEEFKYQVYAKQRTPHNRNEEAVMAVGPQLSVRDPPPA